MDAFNWLGQEVHSGFSIRCYRKTRTKFLVNFNVIIFVYYVLIFLQFYSVCLNGFKMTKTTEENCRKKKNQTLKTASIQFSSVQSLSRVRLCATHELQHTRPPCPSPTPGVHSDSRPSSQWCHPAISSSVIPFLLLPPIPPSIRVFSNKSTLPMRWPKYWSLSFSIIPSKETPGLISFRKTA